MSVGSVRTGRLCIVLTIQALFACGDSSGTHHTAGHRDAGTLREALPPDAGHELDAHVEDAAVVRDAAVVKDAALDASDAPPIGLVARPDNHTCLVQASPAALLSQTGCFAGSPPQPDAALIPYDVAVELWSDGAEKQRYLALPNDAHIVVKSDGDFELPPGAIAVKSFSLMGRKLETRFLVRRADGTHEAYSYVWNEAQSDAELRSDGTQISVGDMTWQVPSSEQCFKCHTDQATVSLGLEALQLNHDLTYPQTGVQANQLRTFEAIGLFDAPLSDKQRALALPGAEGSLEARAKAYLHANCAICHRPGGSGFGSLDLRYATGLAFMNVCDALPMHGAGNIEDARLLAPGDSARSLLVQRMRSVASDFRMPPLGSQIVHEAGVATVQAWIDSLSACPP